MSVLDERLINKVFVLQRRILNKRLGTDWETVEDGFNNWREWDKLAKKKPFWKKIDIFSLKWWKGVITA